MAMFADVTAESVAPTMIEQCERLRPDLVIYEAMNTGAGVAASVLGIPAVAYAIALASFFYGALHGATARYQREVWLQRGRTPPEGAGLLASAMIDPVPPTLRHSGDGEDVIIPIRAVAYNESTAEVPPWLRVTRTATGSTICGFFFVVPRIRVRVHEKDGDRLDAERLKLMGERGERSDIEWHHDLTPAANPLGHLEPQLARDQWFVAAVVQVEGVGSVAARDFEHIAKPCCRNERGLRAFALDQRVDDQGRAVIDEIGCARRELHLVEAVEDAFNEISIRGRAFGIDDPVTVVIIRDEIGEGATDIDGNGEGHFRKSWSLPRDRPQRKRSSTIFEELSV